MRRVKNTAAGVGSRCCAESLHVGLQPMPCCSIALPMLLHILVWRPSQSYRTSLPDHLPMVSTCTSRMLGHTLRASATRMCRVMPLSRAA